MRVVSSNDYQSISIVTQIRLTFRGYSLLEMITKTPSANTAATPSFCLNFICNLMTMVIGRLIIMASLMILTALN